MLVLAIRIVARPIIRADRVGETPAGAEREVAQKALCVRPTGAARGVLDRRLLSIAD
jgi:hypothetical protein